jgi:hypothetical protein
MLWQLPVRPQDVTWAVGFVGLAARAPYINGWHKRTKGPSDFAITLQRARLYLPEGAKDAIPVSILVDYLKEQGCSLASRLLAPGYLLAKQQRKPPFVYSTADGRMYALPKGKAFDGLRVHTTDDVLY